MRSKARRAGNFGEEQHDEPISTGITSPSGSDTDSQSTTGADPHEDRPGYTAAQLDRAETILNRFYQWREDNPSAWEYMEAIALNKAAQGQRVSARALIETIRAHDLTDVDGRPSKPNNDYAAAMARTLTIEHPEIAPHVERRSSIYDVLLGC